MDRFGTVLQCMDGRPQRKVADFLTQKFSVVHVDVITTAGLVKHLVTETPQTPVLMQNLTVSLERHESNQIAVVAHADCAGNPVADHIQKKQVSNAVQFLTDRYPHAEVVGLWVGPDWEVEGVPDG